MSKIVKNTQLRKKGVGVGQYLGIVPELDAYFFFN